MTVPKRVLDLFCGAGGAAMGLHLAFPNARIIGVDNKPQPRYPFEFIQADALEYPIDGDFNWASPMCQDHTWAAKRWHKKWPNQIAAVRKRFVESGKPYVIENVVGAPLLSPARLCGLMFGLKVIRHRLFECSFPVLTPEHPKCTGAIQRGEAYTVAGHGAESKSYKYQDWADAMDIQWMGERASGERRPRRVMCPFHACDGKTLGQVWLWGMVTHKHKVKVCRTHEQVYRDYGWIRVYRRRTM